MLWTDLSFASSIVLNCSQEYIIMVEASPELLGFDRNVRMILCLN